MKKMRVNIVSESAISVQGHGVHTAYEEMCRALESRDDVEVIRNEFGKKIDCDVIHLHTVGPRTWQKLLQKGPKKIISAHVVPDSFVGSLVGARIWKPLAKLYLKWFYNRADLVLAVSNQTKNDLLSLGVRAPIEILYNFIDTSMYTKVTSSARRDEIRAQLGIQNDSFVVIGAGQVQPRKRVDVFLTAARHFPNMDFVWVGGMPFGRLAADHGSMAKLMKDTPTNLHFTGMVDLAQMAEYYHIADAFMLPSEQETFGLVVIEAAAAGLPLLLRDLPEYDATFGQDALRCKNDTQFLEAIKSLQNKKIYASWKEASERIAHRFDSGVAAQKLISLYQRLI